MQVTHISIKPVLHHEQFNLYNNFVTNVIAVGSYHLDGALMRIFFGESDSLLSSNMQPAVCSHSTAICNKNHLVSSVS